MPTFILLVQYTLKVLVSFDTCLQEQQQAKQRQLAQEERQCRSYLTLASETVDMFHYLTERIVEPFLTMVSIDCLKVTGQRGQRSPKVQSVNLLTM